MLWRERMWQKKDKIILMDWENTDKAWSTNLVINLPPYPYNVFSIISGA